MAGVEVLVVAGAWALGSVVVSLAVGAVVARAESTGGRGRRERTARGSRPLPVLPLALPAPRTSVEQVASSAS